MIRVPLLYFLHMAATAMRATRKALAIIVLGGLGSVRGTLVASLVLGVVESYGTIFIGSWLNRDAIAFLALIALLMVRPQGLTGAQRA